MRVPCGVRDEEKEEEGGIKKGAIKKSKSPRQSTEEDLG